MVVNSVTPLCPLSIPSDRMPTVQHSSRGWPFTKWIAHGMPKLGQYKWINDVVFYLYQSEDDALRGADSGGTGFFVALPSKRWPGHLHHIHGVTNWHVACRGSSVIRVNTKDGKAEAFDYGSDQWHFIPSGPDIAVSPPLRLNPNIHRAEALGPDFFLTKEEEENYEIDAADDVFMLGRFIDYDGVETNKPAFRFGHISVTNANILQKTGFAGRSIVVDMHSRTGFSGSPVFVYRTPWAIFARKDTVMGGGHLPKLLGVHRGQFPELWELDSGKGRIADAEQSAHLVLDGKYVRGLSGMTCVCPTQAILEALQAPQLQQMREHQEEEWRKELGTTQLPIVQSF